MSYGKIVEGKVIRAQMDKTAVVALSRVVRHPLYGKTIRSFTKLKAHDEKNVCKEGDTVKIIETRPLSKTKRWRVIEVVGQKK